jgi:dihydrolipoamide dehydrogenase
LTSTGKQKVLGEPEGFVNLDTAADTDELFATHIDGVQSAEIVHELVLVIQLGATVERIAEAMHIHPALPECSNSNVGGVHRPP